MKTEYELRNSTAWDFIELNIAIDIDKLQLWYDDVNKQFPHLKFSFALTDYVIPNKKQSILNGGIHSFGISWPVEQQLPIPPKYAARPELYTCVYIAASHQERAPHPSPRKFGRSR